jgi:hypothetical protein
LEEKSKMSDNITINVSGGKQNQVAGKIENNNSTIGDTVASELTAVKFFEAIEAEVSKLPEVQQQEIKQAVEPLKEVATTGQSPAEPVKTSLLDRLRPHGGFIAKCLIAFSEPVLAKLQQTDPTGVIAGVLAVAKEIKNR